MLTNNIILQRKQVMEFSLVYHTPRGGEKIFFIKQHRNTTKFVDKDPNIFPLLHVMIFLENLLMNCDYLFY